MNVFNTPYTTLITAAQLQTLQASGVPVIVFDCSFDLANPAWGADAFAQSHIAGAVHADLDLVLSSQNPDRRASGGRHPLPLREDFAAWLTQVGFDQTMQAVVVDRNNTLYCGRLWWMLKWLGHDAVAVLDGGLPAWQQAGGAMQSGLAQITPAAIPFVVKDSLVPLVDAAHILSHLGQPTQTVMDARGAPRYRGDVEPIDPVAGHIPGALNRPFTDNFNADGTFKNPAQLRAEFDTLLAGCDARGVVHQCGSGVSATPNVLAMQLAGLGTSALYAGSWSDWVSDTSRPVVRAEVV